MDAWERMFIDEEERDRFFIGEELREMETQDVKDIRDLVQLCQFGLSHPEDGNAEISWAHGAILAQIALQLAQINKHLESISKRLEEA